MTGKVHDRTCHYLRALVQLCDPIDKAHGFLLVGSRLSARRAQLISLGFQLCPGLGRLLLCSDCDSLAFAGGYLQLLDLRLQLAGCCLQLCSCCALTLLCSLLGSVHLDNEYQMVF